jgi:shikimate kinase
LSGRSIQENFRIRRTPSDHMKTNIVLIGYMGVGKSEVGGSLARSLKMKYIDTDDMIVAEEGRSIPAIFKADGEEYFRNCETRMLDKLSGANGNVISTGGGIVLRKENVKKLKELGPLVLLTSRPEVIEKRLKKAKNRPLLDVGDRGSKIRKMLESRGPVYDSVADLKVDTSDASVDEVVKQIVIFHKGEKK